MADSFPRQQARTRRFTLGAPRTFHVSPDGARVLFLRSPNGTDSMTALWEHNVASGEDRLVVDPGTLGGSAGALSAQERARRERRREQAGGIVAYATDAAATTVVFAAAGALWVVDVVGGEVRALDVNSPIFDPRIDPTGRRVSWCCDGELRVVALDGTGERALAYESNVDITWGQAEFVAAEEMHRDRGQWWAPDGTGLLATRVDVGPVGTWWVSDPAQPGNAPAAHRYPAAGSADADVELWWLGLDGTRCQVVWDRATFPYLVAVDWRRSPRPLVTVEQRDHKACAVLEVDVSTGATTRRAGLADDAWVEWPSGLPALADDDSLVWTVLADDTVRLVVADEVVTPVGLQVRAVISVGAEVVFSASRDPRFVDLWRWSRRGLERLSEGGVVRAAAAGGGTVVALVGRPDMATPDARVLRADGSEGTIASRAETPAVTPRVSHLQTGPRALRTGVVLPAAHRPGDRWPVLLCPYGGPSAQMVLGDQRVWLEAQWRADQGFAVVVADGRGSPGRGPSWERAIHGDFATDVLADQIDALHGAAAADDALDLGRVGIMGWSFGGYLAALAVLRRPDVFHAAVAGAPVTDWRLYDTYYTERYLGHPDTDPGAYDRSSLLDDAARLERPLLLVHGLVDDNVVVAHTLRLSQRLLEAGRPHSVLPLTGMTHMASGEDVAEHLVALQMRFLRDALVR